MDYLKEAKAWANNNPTVFALIALAEELRAQRQRHVFTMHNGAMIVLEAVTFVGPVQGDGSLELYQGPEFFCISPSDIPAFRRAWREYTGQAETAA